MQLIRVAKTRIVAAVAVLIALCAFISPASSADATNKSRNVRIVQQKRGILNGGEIAADGRLVAVAGVAGTEERFQHLSPNSTLLYRTTRDGLRELGSFRCPLGRQQDISLWNGYLIQSGGAPIHLTQQVAMMLDPSCDNYREPGLRIVDVTDPSDPRQTDFAPSTCVFTHTLVPVAGELYIYGSCSAGTANINNPNRNRIQIFRLNERTGRVSVVSKPRMQGDPSCRDITYFAPKKVVACMAEVGTGAAFGPSTLYDVSDPANPRRVATLEPPRLGGSQGPTADPTAAIYPTYAQFTWDGRYLMVVDRGGENSSIPNCTAGATTVGELLFYDVSDLRAPRYVGSFVLPDRLPTPNWFQQCAPFRANVLPMKDADTYVATVSWQNQGLTVVDFSNPSDAKEIAHFQADGSIVPTSYWYNGRIYASDFAAPADHGVWVLEVAGLDRRNVRYFDGPFNASTQIPNFR